MMSKTGRILEKFDIYVISYSYHQIVRSQSLKSKMTRLSDLIDIISIRYFSK